MWTIWRASVALAAVVAMLWSGAAPANDNTIPRYQEFYRQPLLQPYSLQRWRLDPRQWRAKESSRVDEESTAATDISGTSCSLAGLRYTGYGLANAPVLAEAVTMWSPEREPDEQRNIKRVNVWGTVELDDLQVTPLELFTASDDDHRILFNSQERPHVDEDDKLGPVIRNVITVESGLLRAGSNNLRFLAEDDTPDAEVGGCQGLAMAINRLYVYGTMSDNVCLSDSGSDFYCEIALADSQQQPVIDEIVFTAGQSGVEGARVTPSAGRVVEASHTYDFAAQNNGVFALSAVATSSDGATSHALTLLAPRDVPNLAPATINALRLSVNSADTPLLPVITRPGGPFAQAAHSFDTRTLPDGGYTLRAVADVLDPAAQTVIDLWIPKAEPEATATPLSDVVAELSVDGVFDSAVALRSQGLDYAATAPLTRAGLVVADIISEAGNGQRSSISLGLSVADSDGDGMSDKYERDNGLDSNSASDATQDRDRDGLDNLREFQLATLASVADSDGDGLRDGDEVNDYGTDPLIGDSDQDGLDDGAEISTYNSDPLSADTDGDGINDGAEVLAGTDPLVPDITADEPSLGLPIWLLYEANKD